MSPVVMEDELKKIFEVVKLGILLEKRRLDLGVSVTGLIQRMEISRRKYFYKKENGDFSLLELEKAYKYLDEVKRNKSQWV